MKKTKKTPRAHWERDQTCWEYMAPDGYRFGGDLHHFCYDRDLWTWKEAQADAKEREKAEPLALCTDPACDWCRPAERRPALDIVAILRRSLTNKMKEKA